MKIVVLLALALVGAAHGEDIDHLPRRIAELELGRIDGSGPGDT